MRMKDEWFDKGYDKVIEGIIEATGITLEQASNAYSYLSEAGLIDYDVEKEIFWDLTQEERYDGYS